MIGRMTGAIAADGTCVTVPINMAIGLASVCAREQFTGNIGRAHSLWVPARQITEGDML